MLSTRKSLLVAAALVLGGPAASAADLGGDYGYGTSLKDAPYMAPMPAPSRGWYVRVDGGYNWYTNPGFNVEGCCVASNAYMDGAWSVGGGIGHYFGRGFRGDITVDHIFNADAGSDLDCGCASPGSAKFDFNSTVFLANLYYDFNRGGRFVPYIGAGIGFAHNETSRGTVVDGCGCGGSFASASENHFAAAAMAGISWRIRGGEPMYVGGGLKDEPVEVSSGHALYLDFGYRFLYLGGVKTGDLVWNGSDTGTDPEVKDVTAHQFRVGLRYDLN
jgi:opacity protein-like surface antigen